MDGNIGNFKQFAYVVLHLKIPEEVGQLFVSRHGFVLEVHNLYFSPVALLLQEMLALQLLPFGLLGAQPIY